MAILDNTPEVYCKNATLWRKWLAENHQTAKGVWLIQYKKASGKPSLSWSESVDEALCFGWIDSTRRSIDAFSYKQYFTKRKPKSNWSKVNKEKVQALISEGKMQAAGLASIELAKANGSWNFLDPIEALKVPKDLAQAFKETPAAETFYEGLSASKKKLVLNWLHSAARLETRDKRLKEYIASALNNEMPKNLN